MLNQRNTQLASPRHAISVAAALALAALVITGLASCSHEARPDPKDTVKYMFDAMRQSDSVALEQNVDLASAARGMARDIGPAVADSNGVTPDPAQRLLSSMVGNGELRKRWLDENQIVLGRAETKGDTALVEVSFIDKITRVQYYNKMRLVWRNNRWIVTDFHTL